VWWVRVHWDFGLVAGKKYTVRLLSFRTDIVKKYLRERNDTFIV
jgi:hypothetical protein